MSAHDDLFDAGAEVLTEVCATSRLVSVELRPGAAPILVDGWQGAETEADRNEDGTEIGRDVVLCEKTVRCRSIDAAGKPWRPSLSSVVKLAGDDRKWRIERLGGLGTQFYTLQLSHRSTRNKQPVGRQRGN